MATMTNYQVLLLDFTPRPIRSIRQYKRTMRHVAQLMNKPALSPAESELLDLLALLVEQYESTADPVPRSSPHKILAHLIESKQVSQADVAKATGIPGSTISAILAGRRQISKANVGRLSAYFRVSPRLFLES